MGGSIWVMWMIEGPVTKSELEATKNELLARLASKEEIKKLATKEEIKKLATKEEIKKLATKKEIKKLATKREIKKLATKDELQKTNRKIEILANQVALNRQDIVEIKDNVRTILEIVDGIAKKFEDARTERAALNHALRRHENRIDDHERRIANIEKKES